MRVAAGCTAAIQLDLRSIDGDDVPRKRLTSEGILDRGAIWRDFLAHQPVGTEAVAGLSDSARTPS